jgi:hypothetical protein
MPKIKTTISIDGNLLEMAKREAAADNSSLSGVFEQALRIKMGLPELIPASVPWPTFGHSGLPSNLTFNDNSELADYLDEQ